MKGNLFVVSGPSGCGKSTICKAVIQKDPTIKLSVSATTRLPREGERDGVEYYFLSKEEFERKIELDEFYEYAKIFENYYGTPKQPVIEMLEQGKDVILEIDIQGARQIDDAVPETILIFIMPPSIEELGDRLGKRNSETREQYQMRMEHAAEEIAKKELYDHIVVNAVLEDAVRDVLFIIHSYRSQPVTTQM